MGVSGRRARAPELSCERVFIGITGTQDTGVSESLSSSGANVPLPHPSSVPARQTETPQLTPERERVVTMITVRFHPGQIMNPNPRFHLLVNDLTSGTNSPIRFLKRTFLS